MKRSLLLALRRSGDASAVPLGSVLADLGNRSFGWSMAVFGLLNLIPMPIGSNMITGVPLLLLTAQMVLGVSHVRLPDFLDRPRVSRRAFQPQLPWPRPVRRDRTRARWGK